MSLDDIYTKSLLHFDGADASTIFTDESGKSWTARGNAQIDTDQSVFGGASGIFDGTGDWIDTPDHADWDFGSGDFTIDLRFRPYAIDRTHGLIGQYVNSTNRVILGITAANLFVFQAILSGTEICQFYCTPGIAADTWCHLAVVRSANTPYMFADGVSKEITTVTPISGKTLPDLAAIMWVGVSYFSAAAQYSRGWIDECRISKGIARWTADFTPPTVPYGYIGNVPRGRTRYTGNADIRLE